MEYQIATWTLAVTCAVFGVVILKLVKYGRELEEQVMSLAHQRDGIKDYANRLLSIHNGCHNEREVLRTKKGFTTKTEGPTKFVTTFTCEEPKKRKPRTMNKPKAKTSKRVK